MKIKRIYERLRYSMIGNLIVTFGLIACFYVGYLVLFLIIEHADMLKGLFWLAIILYFVVLLLVHFFVNYHKTRRYQRAVYGIGDEKQKMERLSAEKAVSRPERYPDEKALRRMERAREKEERAMERARAKAERRAQKENMRW